MDYQQYSYIVGISLFTIYLLGCVLAYGIPQSISDTYYLLKLEKAESLFVWVMSLVSICFMLSCEHWTIFIAASGLILVASFALFKEEIIKQVHILGAGVAAISTQIYAVYLGDWELVVFLACIEILILLAVKRNVTFWLELACFVQFFFVQYKNLFSYV
jgi:hypothetical protein